MPSRNLLYTLGVITLLLLILLLVGIHVHVG